MADKNETSRGIIKQIEVEGVKWNVLTETENGCYCVSQNGYVEKFIPNKPKNNITVKVDVDISEALTGLKSLQREAKKATQVLRELEELAHKVGEGTANSAKEIGKINHLRGEDE